MQISAVFRTSSFRVALTYLILFGVSVLVILGVVYWTTALFFDRQTAAAIDLEFAGLEEQFHAGGTLALVRTVAERSARQRDRRSLYLLTDPGMHTLWGNLNAWPQGEVDRDGWIRFHIEAAEEGNALHAALGRAYLLPGGLRLLVGRDLADGERAKTHIRTAMGLGLALTLLLGAVGGTVMSRHLLRRVEGINQAIRRIRGGEMESRMPQTGSRDEFDELAANLNGMLDQITRLMNGMREVTDNVAHDLRTPLQRLRSRIDLALLGSQDGRLLRQTLEETLVDLDHVLATFNAILTIAQAESGSRPNGFTTIDAAALVADVAEFYQPMAEEKGIALTLEAPGPVTLQADGHLLSQAVANLLDNAVKYTPPQGSVTVAVRFSANGSSANGSSANGTAPEGAEITVADSGPGIPPESREAVLERFVRLDATRSTPGNGLGLSLVAAVARLHGAHLNLEDNSPGLRVRLLFSA